MSLRSSIYFTLTLAFASACSTQPTTEPTHKNAIQHTSSELGGPVTLESSHFFSIYSELNDQHYRMRVRLPASYETNKDKKYPVVFKLDGQWDFLLAASAYNCIYFDGQMPETIFIGIDWGDIEGDIHAIRSRDLMHTPVPHYPESGQADRFITALNTEIFPEIKERFRTDGRHYLIGSSMSANFSTYAIFKSPETIDGAIAIGPNYNYGRAELENLVASHANADNLKGKKLYIGAGKRDYIEPLAQEVVDFINTKNLKGFELRYDNPDDFGHSGMNIPGFAGGYQFLFQRPALRLSDVTLNSYAGTYRSRTPGGNRLSFEVDDGGLIAKTSDNMTLRLLARSQNEFYLDGQFFNVSFEGDNATVETFFGTEVYRK